MRETTEWAYTSRRKSYLETTVEGRIYMHGRGVMTMKVRQGCFKMPSRLTASNNLTGDTEQLFLRLFNYFLRR